MKSYVFIAMVICSIIIYPFEAKSQDSGDLRIKSVTLVDGTVISAQNYAATDAAATDELQVKSVEFTDGTIIEADHFEILDQNMKKTGNDNDKSNTDGTARSGKFIIEIDTGKATPQTVSASRACESIGGNIYLEWDRVYGVMLHAPGLNTWGKIIVESTNSAILGFFSCVEKVDPCNSITLEPYYG